MSLFSKFTSIFASSQTTNAACTPLNTKLEAVLKSILRINPKLDIQANTELLFHFLMEKDDHIDLLFAYMQNPPRPMQPIALTQLLATIHNLFHHNEVIYDVAVKVREARIAPTGKENADTEPDTQPQQDPQFLTQGDGVPKSQPVQQFAAQYFVYLQRLAANVDLYRSVKQESYPYVTQKDQVEPKLMFLWHYKIQNLLNTALGLLHYDMTVAEIQKQVYYDIWKFQRFLCSEIPKVIEFYATLPNSDTLSLYEIYTEAVRHYETMKRFQGEAKLLQLPEPTIPVINNQTMQDFLAFVSKLKVLNQFTFKKSIKVPNKQNPCMGVPQRNPNVLHIKSTSGRLVKLEQIADEMNEKKSNTSINELQDQVDDLGEKQKSKKNHLRGLSTFQAN